VRPIYTTGTPLPSKHPILYIFSTNIRTEFFKHAAHSPFFHSSKCHLFQNATFFGSCIIRILHIGCAKNLNAKLWCQKVNTSNMQQMVHQSVSQRPFWGWGDVQLQDGNSAL
jgi:hypothetical protein